jgi:formylglycine-generating enzyme required for sulfatase activity
MSMRKSVLLVAVIPLMLICLSGCGAVPAEIMQTPSITACLPTRTPAPPTATLIPPTTTRSGPTPTPMPPLVEIPAGEFTMGSETGLSDERPVHVVYLDTFFIDRMEVTNAQFAEFLNEMGNQVEGGEYWLDIDDEDCLILDRAGHFQHKTGFASHPAIEATWYGARAYCAWRDRDVPERVRLPTEAEWEKAAGWDPELGARLEFPWGNDWIADNANADWPIMTVTEVTPHTMAVGSNLSGASPYGALDMAGNVWEWVADWYDREYYTDSPYANPTGPNKGEEKVVRGGSWRSTSEYARTTVRERSAPDYTFDIGFRCVTIP